jgi:hypothetical protein
MSRIIALPIGSALASTVSFLSEPRPFPRGLGFSFSSLYLRTWGLETGSLSGSYAAHRQAPHFFTT